MDAVIRIGKLLHMKTPQLVLSDTHSHSRQSYCAGIQQLTLIKLKIAMLYIVQKDNIISLMWMDSYYKTSDAMIALKLHINVLF